MKILLYITLLVTLSACAKVEKQTIIIETKPEGAAIIVAERDHKTGLVTDKELGTSPVAFELSHKGFTQQQPSSFDEEGDDFRAPIVVNKIDPKYVVTASKDGYFSEETAILDYDALLETGKFEIRLEKSSLWWDTTTSDATNEWINLTVNSEISDVDMWQRLVAAVTKRYHELKEYDFTSGYLATIHKTKTFTTSRGTFLLRSKFIATVMERDPLTYRLILTSEWSNREGKTWTPYPRVFKEDAALITELMNRFQVN